MIVASMCTIPVRKESFKQVAQRILHEQTRPVDRLHVWLNGYSQVPSDLPQDARLEYHLEPTNPGPQVRYRVSEFVTNDAIILTLDDDLIYPTDYIETGVRALEKQNRDCSICFGGVMWDWVVPFASMEYHAHKRLIPFAECLAVDTRVPVQMGGVAFHRASIFKSLMSHELPGFATNDDLMASYNLQKNSYPIVCIAKPANWIREQPDQNSDHALYRRDVKTRVETFKTLVRDFGFVPWSVDVESLRRAPSRLIVCSGEISSDVANKLHAECPAGQTLHTLEIAAGDIGKLVSRPLRAHQEHLVGVPAGGGRFDNLSPVRAFREWRVLRAGKKTIRQYLGWLAQSLNLTSVSLVDGGGPIWSKDVVTGWARDTLGLNATVIRLN